MRDNGIPDADVGCGLEAHAGLAREALNYLVSVRGQNSVMVKQEHFDHFMHVLSSDAVFDPEALLEAMAARRLDATTVACSYVPAAARCLGDRWLADEISFVDVTVGTERLHSVVRRVDELLDDDHKVLGPSALILVAEAEQHTLGAFVLALQLRAAGLSAVVRVAPVASELTQLMAANRFDLALVSLGCSAALGSGIGLVRTLKLLSRGDMRIFVGGSIPVSDERLLAETGADRVLRDVAALLAEYGISAEGRDLDRVGRKAVNLRRRSVAKGDGVEA
ncbi:MAG: ppaA [Rhodobacteraceae bacterium]|nr:MAG: ppaA [Paracoccaceae bacterium]